MQEFFDYIGDSIGNMLSEQNLWPIYTMISSLVLPVLTLLVVIWCIKSMLRHKRKPVTLAYLKMEGQPSMKINQWESSIGRSKTCDIRLDIPTVSRVHAVLSRVKTGWQISDAGSKAGILVNGSPIKGSCTLEYGDKVTLADVTTTLLPISPKEYHQIEKEQQTPPVEKFMSQKLAFFYVTLFQLLVAVQLGFAAKDPNPSVFIYYTVLAALQWTYYYVMRYVFKQKYFEPEILAFYLCSLGISVTATASPSSLPKQLFSMIAGLLLFCFMRWFMSDLTRAMKARYIVGGGAIVLLLINLVLGQERFGAQNWIDLGFITIQPSEFVKVAYIFAGAATLERLLTRRNLFRFICFSGLCIAVFFFINDFGAALIFFVTFVILIFMRSGDVRAIGIITAGAGAAAGGMVAIRPHILSRFSAWRNIWKYVNDKGYQQTRMLIAAASGGLIGLGAGNGFLKNVAAADTDLVFGILMEEFGLIIALLSVLIYATFIVFTARASKYGRSAFYSISGLAAAGMTLFQVALHVFGQTDILPLTGVTLPFVSNGGSSMIASFGLLAFIKMADRRGMPDIHQVLAEDDYIKIRNRLKSEVRQSAQASVEKPGRRKRPPVYPPVPPQGVNGEIYSRRDRRPAEDIPPPYENPYPAGPEEFSDCSSHTGRQNDDSPPDDDLYSH